MKVFIARPRMNCLPVGVLELYRLLTIGLYIYVIHIIYDLPSVCAITTDKYGNLEVLSRHFARPSCTNCFRIISMYRRLSWHGSLIEIHFFFAICCAVQLYQFCACAFFVFFFSALYCHSSVNAVVFTQSVYHLKATYMYARAAYMYIYKIIITRITLICLSAIVFNSTGTARVPTVEPIHIFRLPFVIFFLR